MALSYSRCWRTSTGFAPCSKLRRHASRGMKNGVMPAPGSGRYSYDLLYPLLDVATTLDPSFNIAYRFGATFLAEGYPNGPGRPDQAVALLDKGFANNPGKWQYSTTRRSSTTGRSGLPAGRGTGSPRPRRVPSSPAWMPGLAAFMMGQGGDRRSSRFLWQQLRDSGRAATACAKTREFHLQQLDVADVADRLTTLLRQYVSRDRRSPHQLRAADSRRLAARATDGSRRRSHHDRLDDDQARLDRPSSARSPQEECLRRQSPAPQQAPSR